VRPAIDFKIMRLARTRFEFESPVLLTVMGSGVSGRKLTHSLCRDVTFKVQAYSFMILKAGQETGENSYLSDASPSEGLCCLLGTLALTLITL
jgi:hypothetical protein